MVHDRNALWTAPVSGWLAADIQQDVLEVHLVLEFAVHDDCDRILAH